MIKMDFHEHYKTYERAGIDTIEKMLYLSKNGISSSDAKKLASFGFRGDVKAMEKLRTRFTDYLHDPKIDSRLERFVKAGFKGDLNAIIELSERYPEHDYRRVEMADFVLFLAEHGLKGDKEAMQNIPQEIDYGDLLNCAFRIAYHLTKQKVSYLGIIHTDIHSFSDAQEIRRKVSDKIPIKYLVLLLQYDLGDDKVELERHLEKEINDASSKGDEELVDKKFDELERRKNDIGLLKDKKLMEAFNILKKEGEEVFKKKYSLSLGWYEDDKGVLRYGHKGFRNRRKKSG